MRPVVDLKLPWTIFAVGCDDIDTNLRHQFNDTLSDRHRHVTHGVEDMQAIENRFHSRWVEQIKLVFQSNNSFVAKLIKLAQRLAQYMTWRSMQRCAIRPVGVADQACSLMHPGNDSRSRKVRYEYLVGVIDFFIVPGA